LSDFDGGGILISKSPGIICWGVCWYFLARWISKYCRCTTKEGRDVEWSSAPGGSATDYRRQIDNLINQLWNSFRQDVGCPMAFLPLDERLAVLAGFTGVLFRAVQVK
jgi:hypothetical protein